MQRPNTVDGLFVDDNPAGGIQGTAVHAAWLNAVQEEVAGVIEAMGLTLDPEDNAQLLAALAPSLVPAGALMDWPGETPPDGWLERDGSALLKASYPALYTRLKFGGASCIYGETATEFNLPDDRGLSPRWWDHGAGVDPDAATRADRGDGTTGDHVGTTQQDALQGHWHDVDHGASTGGSKYVATSTDSDNQNVTDNGGSVTYGMAYSATTAREDLANSHGTPRIADETRGKSRAYMPIIKY